MSRRTLRELARRGLDPCHAYIKLLTGEALSAFSWHYSPESNNTPVHKECL